MLVGLLLLQSYLFNYAQKSILNLQKVQHNALMQSEAVTHLENDVISLQRHAISFVDHANENTIIKFDFYLSKAKLNLEKLQINASNNNTEHQRSLSRIVEYLNNYQGTFDQVVANRQKRAHIYTTQFKQPIDDLQKKVTAIEEDSTGNKEVILNDILLTISNLKHATVSYLYKPNFDEDKNVKNNLEHLQKKLYSTPIISDAISKRTANLKKAYNQLVLLTRSYTFSVNVVLTGIENELLYLASQVKNIEKNKLIKTEEQLSDHLVKNTEQANIFTALIFFIITLLSYFIFRSVIKPITQLTLLLNDMNNEKPVNISGFSLNQTEIASVIKAANTLYLKNKQTKELLNKTRVLNTQMEAMNTELTNAIELTDQANKIKVDFVANMSHELRTPMNGILGMLQLLQNSKLPSKQKHYANKAFSSAKNLLHILNNILDFSKLESEKVQLEHIPFTLHTIVSNVQSLFSINAEQKGLRLNINLHVDAGLELIGDPMHLSQIINNCVGNAIKFTDHGEVLLTIETVSQHGKTINLRFSVKDTGIGMTQEQSKIIFNSFSQGDASTTRKYGGTGLGLTISKQLTKLLGGDIQVRSTVGQGSEFFFTLAFTLSEQQALKKHALLISPDTEQINKLMALLANADITTETTQEPLRAIAKISQPSNPFNIVIMSLKQIELKDNFVLQQLKIQSKSMKHKLLLIILISDKENPEPLPKSDNIDITVIGTTHTDKQLKKKLTPKDTEIEYAQPCPLFSGFNALVVDDNKINQEVTSAMLAKLDMKTAIANDGLEALKRVDENDFDIIFMDIQMPAMDGLEATKILRSKGCTIPIIAITAAAHASDKDNALKAGMDDFLDKPIIFKLLYQSIGKHLKSPPMFNTINLPAAKKNVDGNSVLLEKLLSRFISDYSDFSSRVSLLVDNKELNTLRRLIHTLKGLSGTLGLELLQQSAVKVEQQLANEKTVHLEGFNEQLTLTLYAIKQFLIVNSMQNEHDRLDEQAHNTLPLDDIYSLAITARPIPNAIVRQLEKYHYDKEHPLFKLKEAIDSFNYNLVIKLIDQYRNNDES